MKKIPSIFVLVMSTAIFLLKISDSMAGTDSPLGFTPLSNPRRKPWSSTIHGHQIKISYGTDSGHKISVDGKVVGDGYFLSLIGKAEVGGVPVVFGTTDGGAQTCDESAPFVLSLPSKGRPVKYSQAVDAEDEHVPNCVVELGAKVFTNRIIFSSKTNSVLDGKTWQWNPMNGFSKIALTSFVPIESTGWRDLSEKKIKLAYELLDKSDIAPLLFSSVKQPEKFGEQSEFVQAFSLSTPGVYLDGLFIAEACYSHDCPSGVFVVIDYKEKKVYVAWQKDEDTSSVINPAPDQWPKVAQERLKKWLADQEAMSQLLKKDAPSEH